MHPGDRSRHFSYSFSESLVLFLRFWFWGLLVPPVSPPRRVSFQRAPALPSSHRQPCLPTYLPVPGRKCGVVDDHGRRDPLFFVERGWVSTRRSRVYGRTGERTKGDRLKGEEANGDLSQPSSDSRDPWFLSRFVSFRFFFVR